MLTNKVTVKG